MLAATARADARRSRRGARGARARAALAPLRADVLKQIGDVAASHRATSRARSKRTATRCTLDPDFAVVRYQLATMLRDEGTECARRSGS